MPDHLLIPVCPSLNNTQHDTYVNICVNHLLSIIYISIKEKENLKNYQYTNNMDIIILL